MSPEIKIFSYRRCPFAMRVRMTLHEKGIPFVTQEEQLRNTSDELRKLHPEGRVPVLVHGDEVIYESSIITEFLDETFPDPPLMPVDPIERMAVRRWTYWCNEIFKPEIDRFKYGASKLSAEEVAEAEDKLSEYLGELEARLSQNEWLVGSRYSLADIHVFPFVRQLSKVTPPHPAFEKQVSTVKWLKGILSRPAFEKTMEKTEKEKT